jgi:hypothetical protein
MIPTFCPNPHCSHHHDQHEEYWGYWAPIGFYSTLVVGIVRRFKCLSCGKGFSERTFSLDYYTKRTLDYKEIHRAISQGESPSSISRHLGCSSDSVQNRMDRLARNCLSLHTQLVDSVKINESLVADGFESFDKSQFFPNNLNLLLGKQSQFLFGVTHTTLRRKGRMTEKQKLIRHHYENRFKPPPDSVERSFARLLELIPSLWEPTRSGNLTLWTDEHAAYPRAIARVPALRSARLAGTFKHCTVSSKAPRTEHNPLFSANYYDRELRKDIAAFRRESTCFTRNIANGLSRFALHMIYHNYQKFHRINARPTSDKLHAEVAGIDKASIAAGFGWLYVDRPFLSKQILSYDNARIWLKAARTPLKGGRDYLPKYAM